MRISTANAYDTSLESLMDRQVRLSTTQEQLTTGKRVNHASDDPAAMGRVERALASEARSTANQRAVDASNNAMTLTETALADAGNLLQTAREALVAAGNATYSDAERSGVADQLAELRKQLFAVSNRTDGAGTFLFGGQGSNQAPFIDAAGGVRFNGTSGVVQAASGGETLPLTMDGESTWMQARTGNGVFEASAITSTGNAWIDRGSVTNPAALTGSTYRIDFQVVAGATTYSVLKDGLATSQTNVAYASGAAIQIDGMASTVSGAPANGDSFQLAPATPTLSVFDTLDKAIKDLRTPGRSGTNVAQTNAVNLSNLDQVLNQALVGRAQVGATLNRIDGVTQRTSRPATMRPSKRIRWSKSCRCSTT